MLIAAPPKGLPALDGSGVAEQLTRKDVDAKHPEWSARHDLWQNVYTLYEGGQLMWDNRGVFLKQRPKEDAQVYQYRLDHFCYENNLGTGLGWHEAEMFKQPPVITYKLTDPSGAATEAELAGEQEKFYTGFESDCDRQGTNLVDKFRRVFIDLLLYSSSWVLTDMPASDETRPESLADQRKQRLLDPYITVVSPLDVINWETDSYGNIQWAVLYRKECRRTFGSKSEIVERWYFYDRQTYRVYEAVQKDDTVLAADKELQPVALVKMGYHTLAGQQQVPLRRYQINAGWWMGNRTYLACLEHLNMSNALKWSLFMAALAVPVVITDDDISKLTISEVGFIHLGVGSDYKFAEPQGACWEYMGRRVEVLKEEIYRSLYLIAQARTNQATASAQSGVSKEVDMKPSHDVLNGLGDVLRAAIKQTLQDVAAARVLVVPASEADASLLFDVRGFEFDEAVTVEDVDKLTGLYGLSIPSKTFEKELDKATVQAVLPDMDPDTQKTIFKEIDDAPTRDELEQQRLDDQAKRLGKSLDSAVNK